jgi:hypothetical protein
MRVTFLRFPDHKCGYSLVERDDGVVFRRTSGIAGPRLPRDLMQLVVERELRITDGIWAGIAADTVFDSARAELLADLVATTAALDAPTPAQIQRLASAKLAGLPRAAIDPAAIDPAAIDPAAIDPGMVAAAAQALQVEAARWAHLRVGENLRYVFCPLISGACRSSCCYSRMTRAEGCRS